MTHAFRATLKSATVTELAEVECPEQVAKAWMHLIMAILLLNDQDISGFERQAGLCLQLLSDGKSQIGEAFTERTSSERQVLLPTHLVWLMNLQLFHDDSTNNKNIRLVYWQYLEQLVCYDLLE